MSRPRNAAARHPTPFRQALLAFAVAAAVATALWLTIVTSDQVRPLVAWSCAVLAGLLASSVAVTVYLRGRLRQARAHVAAVEAKTARRIADLEADKARLADETLPAVVARVSDGEPVTSVLAQVQQQADPVQQRILRLVAEQTYAGKRKGTAAMAACADIAKRIQALVTSQAAELRDMRQRHGEHLGDLVQADHLNAQAGRMADRIAVLTGARSSRSWLKPIAMERILRGAVGRIAAYQRVQLHSTSAAEVVGYAAEGVMQALAELMDNATKFSAPTDAVQVYVEETQAGIVVTIEDSGVGLGDHQRRHAERAISEPLDLTMLPDTRLGLAVVGCLARKYGLTVSFRPSSRGGTGVVLLVPQSLIKEPSRDEPDSAPVRQATSQSTVDDQGVELSPGGLPKRRRGQTIQRPVQAVPRQPDATRSGALPTGKGSRTGTGTVPTSGDDLGNRTPLELPEGPR